MTAPPTYVKSLGVAFFYPKVTQRVFRAPSASAESEDTWVMSLYVIFAKSIIFACRGKTQKTKSFVATLGYIHWMRYGPLTRERKTLLGSVTFLLRTEGNRRRV